jgi:multisubunit Na+/H+ antiporter MnhC subunit
MYSWWGPKTRAERRIMRRKPTPMLAPLPTLLVLGVGFILLAGLVVLLLRTDSPRKTVGFSICLLTICLIVAIGKLRGYFDRLKRQERNERTHHGE